MTVRRTKTESFDTTPTAIVGALRVVLAEGQETYRYVKTSESDDETRFTTVILPTIWPLVLSTALTIRVDPADATTNVTAEAKSQWFIMGDVFSFYDRYIRDVFDGIERRLDGAG